MKKIYSILISIILIQACGTKEEKHLAADEIQKPTRDSLIASIHLQESELKKNPNLDYNRGANMVAAYLDFYQQYPKDANTADYLFKAADVSMNLQQSKKAIEILQNIYEQYPKYKKASYALFLQAFIYETQLQDFIKAKDLYQAVIDTYPNTRIAEDAAASIKNLGKSDADLIKEFEKKNKK